MAELDIPLRVRSLYGHAQGELLRWSSPPTPFWWFFFKKILSATSDFAHGSKPDPFHPCLHGVTLLAYLTTYHVMLLKWERNWSRERERSNGGRTRDPDFNLPTVFASAFLARPTQASPGIFSFVFSFYSLLLLLFLQDPPNFARSYDFLFFYNEMGFRWRSVLGFWFGSHTPLLFRFQAFFFVWFCFFITRGLQLFLSNIYSENVS